MDEQNFVDQAHDRAVKRAVDTLNKNSAALIPATVIVKQRHQTQVVLALLAYTILYTLATIITVFALVGKINDSYITKEECIRRQDARTALRLGILSDPDLSADNRIYIDKALPAVLAGTCL